MAVVDFAFLAEFAKAEPNGTVSAIGAGLIGVMPNGPGTAMPIFVAGRVRQDAGTGGELTISINPPRGEYSVKQSIELPPAPADADLTTSVFAVQVQVPLAGAGRYVISVAIDDAEPRELELWVRLPERDMAEPDEGDQEAAVPRSGA